MGLGFELGFDPAPTPTPSSASVHIVAEIAPEIEITPEIAVGVGLELG